MSRRIAAVVGLSALFGCGAGETGTGDDLTLTEIATGFGGPTQIAVAPDGRLLVAELNGAEGEGRGRILAVSGEDGSDREVLVEGLLTPTGVVVENDRLWVMEQRRLTVGPFADPSRRVVVHDDLPFNGRSEGTLTAFPGGGVIYNTSGSRDAARPEELKPGSGTLWAQRTPDAEPEAYATGFKHAYAHVVDVDGALWSTEMSDGRLDDAVPPDELVRVRPGDDFGYPRCVGDRVPVAELGADDDTCAGTPRSHALFEPGATPTSVALAPWDDDVLVVALWNRGEIVSVPRAETGRPHRAEVLVAGVGNPQHLVTDGDRLLVSDFSGGRILAIGRS